MTFDVAATNQIVMLLLYAPICLFVFFWLLPRMPRSFRALATIMLAVQIFFVAMQLFYDPPSELDQWLWTLGKEWSISAAVSSAQLALVGAAALMASWLAHGRQAWHRVYIAGFGVLFLMLAMMEFYSLKSPGLRAWILPYLLLGGFLAAITVAHIETSPQPARLWLLYLFIGLSMMLLGGVFVDLKGMDGLCDIQIGTIRFEGCLTKGTLEEALEYLGGWVSLVAVLGILGDIAPSPSRRVRLSLFLLPPVLTLLFSQTANIKPISQQTGAKSASVIFESGAQLHAHRLSSRDREVAVQLFLSVPESDFHQLGYSIRLIDPSSERSVASVDRRLTDQWQFYLGPGYAPVHTQWAELDIATDVADNHAYLAVLTFWRDEDAEFALQAVRSSDRRLLSETQVVLGDLVLEAAASTAPGEVYARFANGFALDPVDMPARARAGDALAVPFTWRAAAADGAEYVQFLHFFHEETGEWWVWDAQPLGARLPTRLWYGGLVDTETWKVPLSETLAPGRYAVFTGLYRVADQERLPASHADGTPFVDARLPLGTLTVENKL